MKLFYAYAPEDEAEAKSVLQQLTKLGYDLEKVDTVPSDPSQVTLAFFSSKTNLNSFWKALPWLKEQKQYSSYPFLRVMPFFLYHSKQEDPEIAFEGSAGELYEAVFSGEFKPFGWDFDQSCPEAEFQRVLNNYEE